MKLFRRFATRPEPLRAYLLHGLADLSTRFFAQRRAFTEGFQVTLSLLWCPFGHLITSTRLARIVKSGMCASGQQFQILNSIVKSVSIDVMDNLVAGKRSSKMALHNETMFLYLSVCVMDKLVPIMNPSFGMSLSSSGHSGDKSLALFWRVFGASRPTCASAINTSFDQFATRSSGTSARAEGSLTNTGRAKILLGKFLPTVVATQNDTKIHRTALPIAKVKTPWFLTAGLYSDLFTTRCAGESDCCLSMAFSGATRFAARGAVVDWLAAITASLAHRIILIRCFHATSIPSHEFSVN